MIRDFKYDSNVDNGQIIISKSLKINGNGHTISADGNSIRIFTINADNVALKNITLTKSSSINGGAIRWVGNNGKLEYANFIECSSPFWKGGTTGEAGGGISWTGDDGTMSHCYFKDCTAQGGAGADIHWSGHNGMVDHVEIIDSIIPTISPLPLSNQSMALDVLGYKIIPVPIPLSITAVKSCQRLSDI